MHQILKIEQGRLLPLPAARPVRRVSGILHLHGSAHLKKTLHLAAESVNIFYQ